MRKVKTGLARRGTARYAKGRRGDAQKGGAVKRMRTKKNARCCQSASGVSRQAGGLNTFIRITFFAGLFRRLFLSLLGNVVALQHLVEPDEIGFLEGDF